MVPLCVQRAPLSSGQSGAHARRPRRSYWRRSRIWAITTLVTLHGHGSHSSTPSVHRKPRPQAWQPDAEISLRHATRPGHQSPTIVARFEVQMATQRGERNWKLERDRTAARSSRESPRRNSTDRPGDARRSLLSSGRYVMARYGLRNRLREAMYPEPRSLPQNSSRRGLPIRSTCPPDKRTLIDDLETVALRRARRSRDGRCACDSRLLRPGARRRPASINRGVRGRCTSSPIGRQRGRTRRTCTR